jgi:hypothetical protein
MLDSFHLKKQLSNHDKVIGSVIDHPVVQGSDIASPLYPPSSSGGVSGLYAWGTSMVIANGTDTLR